MRRAILLAAVLAATLLGPSVADAATSHPLSATIRSNKVGSSGRTTLEAGVVRGGLGEGATLIRFRLLSSTRARITFKVWYERGTFSGAVTVALTNGGHTFSGSGRITGGTGRFAGATGRFNTRANRSSSGLWVQHLTGTLVF